MRRVVVCGGEDAAVAEPDVGRARWPRRRVGVVGRRVRDGECRLYAGGLVLQRVAQRA